MSSDQAAEDGQDPLAPFIIMYASETFDGQERVFTREAYDLHCAAAAHSARCGHPGFVPDEYLNSLVTETTVPAAELCAIGTWERVDGGYRVLDWEAVEVCIDWHARKRGEDPRALAWDREHQAKILAQTAEAMVAAPPCAECGNPSTRTELVAPGQLPAEWDQWPSQRQDLFRQYREPGTMATHPQRRRDRKRVPRRPDRRRSGRPNHPGVPASPVLRPGPHRRVLRRRRILRGLRRALLLPALARVRVRVRPLPPAATAKDSTRTGRRIGDLLGVNGVRPVSGLRAFGEGPAQRPRFRPVGRGSGRFTPDAASQNPPSGSWRRRLRSRDSVPERSGLASVPGFPVGVAVSSALEYLSGRPDLGLGRLQDRSPAWSCPQRERLAHGGEWRRIRSARWG